MIFEIVFYFLKVFVYYTFLQKIFKTTTNMNGVNLTDYFPIKNSYNPVIYMHKKFLPNDIKTNKKMSKEENFGKKSFTQHNQEIKKTKDKSAQFNYEKVRDEVYKTKVINNSVDKDPLVEQTIRFAKDIIPLTIPPSRNVLDNPVYYTIKPSKISKRKHESRQQNFEHDKQAAFNKQKSKTAKKSVCKEKCIEESFSGRESVSRSSKNNTSDDINQIKSPCCSLSESSGQRNFNNEENRKKNKRNEMQKIIVSESFEAIATECMKTSSDAKIKLQLMNEKEKQLLYENIRAPVIKVIKQCFSELDNHNEVNLDLQYVHTAIQSHAHKLDNIIGKLDRIEKMLDVFGSSVKDVSNNANKKSSKLEELGQDILELKDDISSEEELVEFNLAKKRRGNTTTVHTMADADDAGRFTADPLAKGENVLQIDETSSSQLGIRPECLNRIQARYCWTEAAKNI